MIIELTRFPGVKTIPSPRNGRLWSLCGGSAPNLLPNASSMRVNMISYSSCCTEQRNGCIVIVSVSVLLQFMLQQPSFSHFVAEDSAIDSSCIAEVAALVELIAVHLRNEKNDPLECCSWYALIGQLASRHGEYFLLYFLFHSMIYPYYHPHAGIARGTIQSRRTKPGSRAVCLDPAIKSRY